MTDLASHGAGPAASQLAGVLRAAGFTEHAPEHRSRRGRRPADGFSVLSGDDGAVLAAWVPAGGQDPRDLDDFARSYDMALAYAAAARAAGWQADRWGVIWHYARVTA
jgi:hypothetical protein